MGHNAPVKSLTNKHNTTVQFVIIQNLYFTSSVGKRTVLQLMKTKVVHTYRDKFTVASQQNWANHFFLS